MCSTCYFQGKQKTFSAQSKADSDKSGSGWLNGVMTFAQQIQARMVQQVKNEAEQGKEGDDDDDGEGQGWDEGGTLNT
jgi:hypothetical protein